MGCTPGEMRKAIIRNLPAKTGKSFDEWVAIARRARIANASALVRFLEDEHGLGHVSAGHIADRALDLPTCDYDDGGALVARLFSGEREPLRRIYDALAAAARALGDDMRIKPCTTYIPFMRRHQFAIVKPRAGYVLVGLALGKARKPAGRLEAARGIGTGRITHMVRVDRPAAVDAELERWLGDAYRAGA